MGIKDKKEVMKKMEEKKMEEMDEAERRWREFQKRWERKLERRRKDILTAKEYIKTLRTIKSYFLEKAKTNKDVYEVAKIDHVISWIRRTYIARYLTDPEHYH